MRKKKIIGYLKNKIKFLELGVIEKVGKTSGTKYILSHRYYKDEKKYWWNIYNAIPSKEKTYYLPPTKGVHGAKALWKNNPSHEGYWEAVNIFLKRFVKIIPSP